MVHIRFYMFESIICANIHHTYTYWYTSNKAGSMNEYMRRQGTCFVWLGGHSHLLLKDTIAASSWLLGCMEKNSCSKSLIFHTCLSKRFIKPLKQLKSIGSLCHSETLENWGTWTTTNHEWKDYKWNNSLNHGNRRQDIGHRHSKSAYNIHFCVRISYIIIIIIITARVHIWYAGKNMLCLGPMHYDFYSFPVISFQWFPLPAVPEIPGHPIWPQWLAMNSKRPSHVSLP